MSHPQGSEALTSSLPVAVEAELGRLAGVEDGESVEEEAARMTTVAQVSMGMAPNEWMRKLVHGYASNVVMLV